MTSSPTLTGGEMIMETPSALPRAAERDSYGYGIREGQEGMSLRDWFAGQALSSIPLRNWEVEKLGDLAVIKAWAECAYLVADAMLAARATQGSDR